MSEEAQLRADVGQMLIVGFDGAPTQAPAPIQQALNRGEVGGVILFRRNVDTIAQLVSLTTDLHRQAQGDLPPWVAVDQEGGRVIRVREPLTPIPPMRALGQAADQRAVARVSEVLATEISVLGFNLNFAPVLDVDTNPDNPVIGDRAFSSDPERVARAAAGFMVGHHTAGVVPCGKHFPGHGDTLQDSHLTLPRLMHDEERLRAVELFPFKRAVGAGIPMIMTAHIELPVLDAFHPATFSPRILQGLLREELGFEGVIITDCLEMKAVSERYTIEEMVDLGLDAGLDIFLISHTEAKWRAAFERLVARGKESAEVREKIAASAARVRTLKRDLLGHWPRPFEAPGDLMDILGCEEHRQTTAPFFAGTPELGQDPTELDA
ncbi:beta-N-acetylhexosaminidase [Lujinxingia litoralis]|uniref:Beta-N-acetylhexosaminidase n=1 Tax=Lujinxingia litoralis TaxID=2211119 RepID=A0A328C6B0_9DELT|nr:beta-N-acetylhexosaminidase [Lujinxingia litoralis]RAL21737.1 beta-N-acetylhexosaminidase [Lujinxingia litoralis]